MGNIWEHVQYYTAILCEVYNYLKKKWKHCAVSFFAKISKSKQRSWHASLPMCFQVTSSSFTLYCSIMKWATISKPDISDTWDFSWDEDGSITWVDDSYSDDIWNIAFEEIYGEK